MKHLKLFETSEAYNAATLDLPNVSLIEETMSVNFKPYVPETRVVCKYNVTSTSSPTVLRTNFEQNIFKSMEIDGVMLDELVIEYTFDTTGVHTVKYELYDKTKLGNGAPVFYNSNLIECIIPDSVTSICGYVFNNCHGLTSINIPNNVTSIRSSAFSNCNGLTSVTIGNGVTNIDDNAFTGCTGLTSINIPNNVISIGQNVFTNCNSLTSMTVDSNNTIYDSRNNCNAIIQTSTNMLIQGCNNTVIPDSVTNIGTNAFNGCHSLTSITIPSGVTSIGNRAFESCTSLTSINIPSGVTSMGQHAFYYCTSLTSIVSNATTAPTIQSNTFLNVKTGGTLTVPAGSTGYDVWMSTDDYYLGKYNWTKVEQ